MIQNYNNESNEIDYNNRDISVSSQENDHLINQNV